MQALWKGVPGLSLSHCSVYGMCVCVVVCVWCGVKCVARGMSLCWCVVWRVWHMYMCGMGIYGVVCSMCVCVSVCWYVICVCGVWYRVGCVHGVGRVCGIFVWCVCGAFRYGVGCVCM